MRPVKSGRLFGREVVVTVKTGNVLPYSWNITHLIISRICFISKHKKLKFRTGYKWKYCFWIIWPTVPLLTQETQSTTVIRFIYSAFFAQLISKLIAHQYPHKKFQKFSRWYKFNVISGLVWIYNHSLTDNLATFYQRVWKCSGQYSTDWQTDGQTNERTDGGIKRFQHSPHYNIVL